MGIINMLSKALMVMRPNRIGLLSVSSCGFRSGFKNPYLDDPTPMSDQERQEQTAKPVWDRTFDHKRYMQHQGPLKLSTGLAFLDVEPFPRMKLMKLYYLILQEVQQLPEEYPYKYYAREQTRWRMKVVDENESIRKIEEKIAHGIVEQLIQAAHNELKLLRIMQKWRPWEMYGQDADEEKEHLLNMASFRHDNPFAVVHEHYDDMKHDPKPRSKPNQQ